MNGAVENRSYITLTIQLLSPTSATPWTVRRGNCESKGLLLMDILDNPPKKKAPREASFWAQVKSNLPRGWSATRLESRATLGVPDVIFMDDRGAWHMVELKPLSAPWLRSRHIRLLFRGSMTKGVVGWRCYGGIRACTCLRGTKRWI